MELMPYIGAEPAPPSDDSDKLTPEQVKQFEREHKLLFIYLSITNNTYVNLFNKALAKFMKNKTIGEQFTDSPEYKAIKPLGQTILSKAKTWFDDQYYLEKTAGIPKVKVSYNDFLIYKKRGAILNQANEWIDTKTHKVSGKEDCGCHKSGIGIIPLIIWGVIAIVGAISAAYVVHRLTTTTQDRQDLLKAAEQTCKDMNLTPAECSDVVTTTQKEESKNAKAVTDTAQSITGGISKILLFGLLGLAALTFAKGKR